MIRRTELAATTAAQWKERAAALFTEDDSPAADIVRATDEDMVGSNSYDVPSTPTW